MKPKIKIKRARCMCSGCQENGDIWTLNEDLEWCRTVSVIGNYDVWEKVVLTMREYGDVLFDDSGIEEGLDDPAIIEQMGQLKQFEKEAGITLKEVLTKFGKKEVLNEE